MHGGKKGLLTAAAFAAAGCAADDGKLDIRAISDPLSAASKRGSPMMVEGRTALALGNVGTALEAFRKALRQQPDSIEALAGIAASYERMGRFDLSRVNYEAALAIAPNNPVLLNSFAASLQLQGRHAEAAALRAEAVEAEAADVAATVRVVQAEMAPAPQAALKPSPVAIAAVARPAPIAAATAQATSVSMPAPAVPIAVVTAQATPVSKPAPAVPIDVVTAEVAPVTKSAAAAPQEPPQPAKVAGTTTWAIDVPKAAPAVGSITVALPAARPAAPAQAEALPPAPKKTELAEAPAALNLPAQPRLQRLSLGEVALLTGTGPAWRAQVVAESQRSITARFVPLRTASAATRPNIRLLNAARHQGLAAQTRTVLLDRGWRKIAIGDAAQVRSRSIVLYPASRQQLGKRLAAQFGFASAINVRSEELIVLLGRDAPAVTIRRARG